ncbi:MAG: glutaredoxin domain-containing protein [Psychrobacillus sp.]
MKSQWYNKNRNWEISEFTCNVNEGKNKSIRSIKFHKKFNVIAILRFNNEIEIKSLDSKSSIILDENYKGLYEFIFWDIEKLRLYVFVSKGGIIVFDINIKLNKARIKETLISDFKGMSNLVSISNDYFELTTLHKLNEFTDKYINKADISSIHIENELIIVGTSAGEIQLINRLFKIESLGKSHSAPVSFIKFLNDLSFITCGKDSKVFLYKKNNVGKWNSRLLGTHTGWVLDAILGEKDNFLYTAGADGIICKFDLIDSNNSEVIPVNRGVISSLHFNRQNLELVIGNYDGSVLGAKKVINKNNQHYHKNSIWNMYYNSNEKMLFTGGSDGRIICTDVSDGDIVSYIDTSAGWINGMDYYKDKFLIAVSSQGQIIFWNEGDDKPHEILSLENYWLNNVKIQDEIGVAFLATAEGDILILDIELKEVVHNLSKHNDQVLDVALCIESGLLISISIDGMVCFWDLYSYQLIKNFFFEHFHPTSLAISIQYNKVIIASLEGDIIKIDISNFETSYLQRLHIGRIWKVSCFSNIVTTIGTDSRVRVWDIKTNQLLDEWSDNTFLTTCLLHENSIFVGNQDGEYTLLKRENNLTNIQTNDKLQFTNTKENVVESIEFDHMVKNFRDGKITIYCDQVNNNNSAYTQRIISILKDMQLEFLQVDVSKNQTIKKNICKYTGWNVFPQVLFDGKFIGAGTVFLEMYRTNTLKRLTEGTLTKV